MKIIVTTSDKYHHIIPIFCYLFNKYWDPNKEVEIVGYKKPDFELPKNFTFISLGEQGKVEEFSTDLRKYFENQPEWFIWMMEDTFIKGVDFLKLKLLQELTYYSDNVGRINLSKECVKQEHVPYIHIGGLQLYKNIQTANYRLSTQPSIWSKKFLLQYLTPGLTPWKFETQKSINDGWEIIGLGTAAVEHNEGVRKHNIYNYDFTGIHSEVIEEMKQLKYI